MIKIDESTLDTIIEAKKNNKLAFFIGAGFSKNSETEYKKIPLWADLISGLKKSLDVERENDYLKIAQMYYLKYGEYQYFNKLKQYFDVDLEPSRVHKKLFELLPNLVVTTNWDCLLEQTTFDQGLNYDVIVSDIDLVKSTYFHKILKMHGDFKHHNIVFKEDDYLKYSENFPLIENYLKSILSTYVVVFLGYSYSDIDLKLITKWIETKSAISPPKFLLTTRYNEAESSYLKNHGISLLASDSVNNNDILVNFFDLINLKNELYRFNKIINKKNISEEEKYVLVDFFYKKIKVLEELDSIFPAQIKSLFSNMKIDNHKGCYGLYFISDDVLTRDYSKEYRQYYVKLNKIFLESKGGNDALFELVKKIFFIFSKANIFFLKFKYKTSNDDYIDIRNYIDLSVGKDSCSYIDFSNKGVANELMYSGKTSRLLDVSSLEIKKFIKDKLFIKLAISSFNANIALMDEKEEKEEKEDQEVKSFKDYFDFYNISGRGEYKFINDFLNFNVLENFYYKVSQRMSKNLKVTESRLNGGFSFDCDETEAELMVKSYLDFMYKNNIAMELFSNTKNFFSMYMDYKIKMVLMCGKRFGEEFFSLDAFKPTVLGEIDVFIMINFMNKNEILFYVKSILELMNANKSINLNNIFVEDFDLKNYIKKSFLNLMKVDKLRDVESQICNIILIFSLVNWDEDDFLIEGINKAFEDCRSYVVVDVINNFIGLNSNIYAGYKINFNSYFELLINSIINHKINGFIRSAIEHGKFSNVFDYTSLRGDYNNKDLIESFIYFLNSPSNHNKLFYTANVLPFISNISKYSIKEIIYSFVFGVLDLNINKDKFEIFLMFLIYDKGFSKFFLVLDESKIYLTYLDDLLGNSKVFNKFDLKNIVLNLSKNRGNIFNIFRELVRKHNLDRILT